MVEANDDGLAAAVDEEIAHGKAEGALNPQAAKLFLEISETVDRGRPVRRSSAGSADERRDRGRDRCDGPDAARNLLDVHTWGGGCDWHVLRPFRRPC